MAQFYIEKLVVTGAGKTPSVVEFGKGLNFILGPSNTGKSLISDIIDYMFGYNPSINEPLRLDPTLGYDVFTLHTQTPNGTVVFRRKYGENKINVSGTDPNFESKDYSTSNSSKNNISSVWLQMIGIEEPHKILMSQAGKTQQLSLRSFLHMFFIKQSNISRTASILYNPKLNPNMASTPSKAAALFLMTGKDANDYDVTEDKKIRKAKRDAVIDYIRGTMGRYAEREIELQKQKEEFANSNLLPLGFSITDVDSQIDNINREIEALQEQINHSIATSRTLMQEIYSGNSRLAECETIGDRFAVLRNQYSSDIERLTFVVDGNIAYMSLPKREHCPFCDSEINSENDTSDLSYIESSRAELQHIHTHLIELEKAEADIASETSSLTQKVRALEEQKAAVDKEVSSTLTPRMLTLKDKLRFFRYIIEINKELDIIKKEEIGFKAELFEKETEEEPTEVKHDINQFFDFATVQAFESKLVDILKACNYQGASSARLSMQTFDLEVDGRGKAISNGGGYCGFLNTVMSLALIEFLEEQGVYSPRLLFIDSPLTQLSESEHKEKPDTLVSGLIDYLLGIYDSSSDEETEQIIIIEHKDRISVPLAELAQNPNVNIIEFTQDKAHGRYGFLTGVFENE